MIKIQIYQKLKTELLDWIFPKKCLVCDQEGDWICQYCLLHLLEEKPVIRRLKNFTIYACANYNNKSFQKAINYLKYQGITDLAPVLAKIMAALISAYSDQSYDLVSAIPLHHKRLSERTFNQSELLAREIGNLLTIESADLLIRSRYSDSQTHLSDEERKKNVKDIFNLDELNCQKIVGKKILLIDDVVTSGATMSEAVQVLIKNGASQVTGLALASR